MFVPPVAKTQTKEPAGSSNKQALNRSTRIEQIPFLHRTIGHLPARPLPAHPSTRPEASHPSDPSIQQTQPMHASGAAAVPGLAWNFANIPLFAPDEAGPSRAKSPLTMRALPGILQAKLEIGPVDDPLEREADRVAEHVMRMPDPSTAASPARSGAVPEVQRKCSCGGSCDKCKAEKPDEEEGKVQRKPAAPQISVVASSPASSGMTAPPIVHEVLRSPGQPLDAATRAFFEPRFGHDFSGVRVHADQKAAESAKLVGAQAYTVGQQVVVGAGQYAPGTAQGARLIAHELAHVAQQKVSIAFVQRSPADPSNEALENRVAALEKKDAALEKKGAAEDKKVRATRLDSHWKDIFHERMASYWQAVDLISGGIDAAKRSFDAAHLAQELANKLADSYIEIAFSLAPGFGWIAGRTLGRIGIVADKITDATTKAEKMEQVASQVEKTVETVTHIKESGAKIKDAEEFAKRGNELAKSPVEAGVKSAKGGLTAEDVSKQSYGGFLSQKSAALHGKEQQIAKAFVERENRQDRLTDAEWEREDIDAQQAAYVTLFADLISSGNGVEWLKEPDKLASIIEKHMWAHWIMENVPKSPLAEWSLAHPGLSNGFGAEINKHLQHIGILKEANVDLIGDYLYGLDYLPYRALDKWAKSYHGALFLGSPD